MKSNLKAAKAADILNDRERAAIEREFIKGLSVGRNTRVE